MSKQTAVKYTNKIIVDIDDAMKGFSLKNRGKTSHSQ